jgi:hypothetical protein
MPGLGRAEAAGQPAQRLALLYFNAVWRPNNIIAKASYLVELYTSVLRISVTSARCVVTLPN